VREKIDKVSKGEKEEGSKDKANVN